MKETIESLAPDLNELRVFGAVAERRSFVGASRALGMPKATVSRKVKALEDRLGVRLLQRTTRRVSLTEVGAAFLERCQRIEEEIAEAQAVVGLYGARPRGTLRVTAPYTLASEFLVPLLPEFLGRWPEVHVALGLRNEPVDLVGRGVDVALWPWPLGDTSYASRLVARSRPGIFASPAYLRRRGRPAAPADLAAHAALLYAGGGGTVRHEWELRRGESAVTIPVKPVLVCNDMAPLRAAAVAGMGVLLAGEAVLPEALRRRELVPVLPDWSGPVAEVRAVFPSRSGLAPKVRVFVDFLVERLGTRTPR
jgi:LysR family transcriptional regulator for bpeEF and oprC